MGYKAIKQCLWHECGRVFMTDSPRRIYCSPACRKKAERENMRQYNEMYKKPTEAIRKQTIGYAPRTTSTLSDAVIDLEAYNRTHGTNYSYGQAVAKGII